MTENTPIERVFLRLAATYGAAWDRALGQAPIGDVKTVWAHELSAFLPPIPGCRCSATGSTRNSRRPVACGCRAGKAAVVADPPNGGNIGLPELGARHPGAGGEG